MRAFDEKKQTKLTVYNDWDKTLHQLKINSLTPLIIETKTDFQ